MDVLRSAIRRIAAIVAVLVAGTAAISVMIGALAGANLLRSLAVGFYLAGAGVLIGCLALGIRGPVRVERSIDGDEPVFGSSPWGLVRPLGRRNVRKATPEERVDSRRSALGLFALGLLLILVGTAFDPSRRAF